jgi:tRNA threonylcarbamoyladenosine biosynthesis protein TsaB
VRIAQGLGLGSGVPLVPVGTLDALAQEAWRAHGATVVVACLDARMREVYAASYVRSGEAWRQVHAPAVTAPDGVIADAGAFGAGDGFAVYPALAARLGLARHDARCGPPRARSASSRCRSCAPARPSPRATPNRLYVATASR